MPRTLTFAPVDFERETLADGLAAAVFATLGFIAGLAGGAHVVFDYSGTYERSLPAASPPSERPSGAILKRASSTPK